MGYMISDFLLPHDNSTSIIICLPGMVTHMVSMCGQVVPIARGDHLERELECLSPQCQGEIAIEWILESSVTYNDNCHSSIEYLRGARTYRDHEIEGVETLMHHRYFCRELWVPQIPENVMRRHFVFSSSSPPRPREAHATLHPSENGCWAFQGEESLCTLL